MHSGGCSTTMSGFRGSPSLRYAYWRLPNHYVRVHHLSGMHIGGCSTTMLGFTISQVCTLEVAQPLCWSSWFTISQVCTLEVAQPLCWGSWFTISQVCTLEVAQPLCWGARAHHLSGTHTGGWQTGTCFFLTPCGQP